MADSKKQVTVKLEVSKSDVNGDKDKHGTETREFPIQQAQGILNHEKKIGKIRHKLPANSPFEHTEDGEIVKKQSK